MQSRYTVSGTALKWFESYISDRVQSVVVGNNSSQTHTLKYGVLQGSVVGPSQFTLYSAPLEDVISGHGINVLSYADDTQLYCSFRPGESETAISRLECCIADVKDWMSRNKLKLNVKTEVVHVTSRFTQTEPIKHVTIGNSAISPTDAARNLGVIFDQHLSMTAHVNNLCKSASFALRSIGQIRKYLDRATTEKLVHAFVTSRLDYCNCLLFGLPDKLNLSTNFNGFKTQLHDWSQGQRNVITSVKSLVTYTGCQSRNESCLSFCSSYINHSITPLQSIYPNCFGHTILSQISVLAHVASLLFRTVD